MKQLQKIWTEYEVQIIKDNYGKLSYSEISKLLPNRTIFQIRNKANYEGLCSSNNLRKYSINKEFFRIPNVINSYWAGFIAADGCVDDKSRLSIGLKLDDYCHLEAFTKAISYTNIPKKYKDRCSMTINCKEIILDLEINFNIIPRKSKILQPPNIEDEEMIASFIKGVIDGDGSVMKDSIVIYGTESLLKWIKFYFDKWTSKSKYKLANVRKIQEYLFAYKIGTKRRDEIFNKLKKLECDELKRKW